MLASILLFLVGLAAALAIGLALWWALPPDPAAELAKRRLALATLVREPRPDLGARIERWRMVTTTGDTLSALWRPAPPDSHATWTAVLLGGLETGDRAAALLPADLPVHALAVDWPWRGPRSMGRLEFARHVPRIREAILRSPAVLALGVDAVRRDGAGGRVVVLGASLGVPPALAALRLTDGADALVLLDGAADLEGILRSDLRGMLDPDWLAAPLAAAAARLIHPIEPAHHGAAAARLPTLLVNAAHDERLPRAAVERLHAALPHADRRWREDTHVGPQRLAVIASVARDAHAWLETLPPR